MKPSDWIKNRAGELANQTSETGPLVEVAAEIQAVKDFVDSLIGDIDGPEQPFIPIGTTITREVTNQSGMDACASMVPVDEKQPDGLKRACNKPATWEIVHRADVNQWNYEYRCDEHKESAQ